MMKKHVCFVIVLILIGCAPAQEMEQHVMEEGEAAEYSVLLTADPTIFEPGKPVHLQVAISHSDGSPVDLELMHERLLHVMLIRDDLQHFVHIHAKDEAEGRASGRFALQHVFPESGRYRVMVEFKENDALVAVPHDLVVEGAYTSVSVQPTAREVTTDDYVVRLNAPEEITAGMMHMFSFDVFSNNQPVDDLENYLGEKMHLAVWGRGLNHFEHAHPVLMNKQVMFHVAFPEPGLYKLYPQFQHHGRVLTVAFVVRAV